MARRSVWQIVMATAAILLLALGLLLLRTTNQDQTVMAPSVIAPGTAEFSDDAFATFSNTATPDINNDRTLDAPAALIVSYDLESGPYQPALRMDLDDNALAAAAKITPYVPGTWQMHGRSAVKFVPDTPWPANQKFRVKFNRDIFNPDIDINAYNVVFHTAPLQATVRSFDIYDAGDRHVTAVAVVSFNYAVDTHDFANTVKIRLDGHAVKFNVRFDKFDRTAFITSAPITVTDTAQSLRMNLGRVTSRDGTDKTEKQDARLTIAAADNFFKISDIAAVAIDDTDGNSNQVILINTTAPAAPDANWAQYVNAYLLPKNSDQTADGPHHWQTDEITSAVLEKSEKLTLNKKNFATPGGVYQYAFAFSAPDAADRYIYVSVANGLPSAGGFELHNSLARVMPVPYPAAQVKITGSGAILSLAGDRRLGIMARGGVSTAHINLYKVKSSEINHLITQTYDVFAHNMEFKSWSFGAYDMSVVFQKKISFADASPAKTNYASLDLGDYLNRTRSDETGIFIIQAAPTQSQADYSDRRLILLTNLGIIRKANLDGTSTLFVSNLDDGTPAVVDVQVLGRNGNAIWAGQTNQGGRADIPKFDWSEYKNEREPVVFVARRGDDVAFIPYHSGAQRVEYSKFDIDGTYANPSTAINAFVFSDRGIYRPGETAVFGAVVKNKSFNSLSGVPVRFELRDARGRIVAQHKLSLASDGMFDIKYEIPHDAILGEYNARVQSLNARGQAAATLGTATIRVEEFVPDTMKISAEISGATTDGWLLPDAISANIVLRNLFGTPAAGRQVTATATLRPTKFSFAKYPQYIFAAPQTDGVARRTHSISADFRTQTNSDGMAHLDISFNQQIPRGTYMMNLTVRGDGDTGGHSVQTAISARVSDAPFMLGYYADGNLEYINRNTKRNIKLIAIAPSGMPTDATPITLRLMQREELTSLIKDQNGYYKYQTVNRDKQINQQSINITSAGYEFNLDTRAGGTYFVQIQDANGNTLNTIEYFVAADENTALTTDKSSEMKITLNADKYAPGDKIQVAIAAPYSGTGLITIERDRVYAYKWFKTEKTTSVQTITVPDGFEGTGYVNVSFVRDINSPDIFTSPYAYAVAPFAADIARRTVDVKLSTPDKITNNRLTVKYTTDKNARIMIFAVDAGILQVARYKMPQPLAHFFEKAALQVDTYQILSLLLPEYRILREFAKTGGGDYDNLDAGTDGILTNPFGRQTQAPVAFYSGIIDARANTPASITFDIPEYFSGAVRVFAVAANNSAVGADDATTQIQPPLIITTSAPLFATPNDTFDATAIISNLTGTNADIALSATVSNNLNITNAAKTTKTIADRADAAWPLPIRVGSQLGTADITIDAVTGDVARRTTATLSVRPATTLTTEIQTGVLDSKSHTLRNLRDDVYPELATRRLYVSTGASAMMLPLMKFLADYEYPCTEQIVSRAIPYVLGADSLKIPGGDIDRVAETISTLKNRQNDDGSFSLWAGDARSQDNAHDTNTANLTAYVVQFLTMARDAGFAVPDSMTARGLDFLRTYAGQNITSVPQARAVAYAIYVATVNGFVTTAYIDGFTQYADKNMRAWDTELTGAYIASAYKLLHQDATADKLIAKYKPARAKFEYVSEFDNSVANDSIFAYLYAKHFDTQSDISDAVIKYVNSGNYSSYTSAVVLMGLAGNVANAADITPNIAILADGTKLEHTLQSGTIVVDIPLSAKRIEIKCPDCGRGAAMRYALMQTGFAQRAVSSSNGLDVVRHYYNANGDRITRAAPGDTVTVKIFVRARGGDSVPNVAVTDLLPAGFVPNIESVSGDIDYFQPREDRMLFYITATPDQTVITYTAQIGVSGTFTVPAITAASMYNPAVHATTSQSTFTVSNVAGN